MNVEKSDWVFFRAKGVGNTNIKWSVELEIAPQFYRAYIKSIIELLNKN